MSERAKQTKVRSVEVVADYRPDTERMLQALMLLLDIDDTLPAGEHEDAVITDSVS